MTSDDGTPIAATGGPRTDPRPPTLAPGDEADYLELVGQWKTILDAHPGVRMKIVGHTDSTGPLDYNQWLSEQRAGAIAGWMQERGIAADRFTVEGAGPADPIDDNDTTEGRSRNRRIQVTLDGLLMV